MKTEEIPRDEWPTFLNGFTRRHAGWLADVEVFDSNIGNQIEGQGLSFKGITAELITGRPDTIAIMLGSQPDDHITHTITAPSQVSVERTDEGADVVLAIKGSDGVTALLRFHAESLPEMVDTAVA